MQSHSSTTLAHATVSKWAAWFTLDRVVLGGSYNSYKGSRFHFHGDLHKAGDTLKYSHPRGCKTDGFYQVGGNENLDRILRLENDTQYLCELINSCPPTLLSVIKETL